MHGEADQGLEAQRPTLEYDHLPYNLPGHREHFLPAEKNYRRSADTLAEFCAVSLIRDPL